MFRDLLITVASIPMLKGTVANSVEKDSWTWTIEKGRLGVMMSKTSPGINIGLFLILMSAYKS
jgi:hypothetical protein